MRFDQRCEAPLCDQQLRWFVGLFASANFGRGHGSCDEHLAECVRISLHQLTIEGWEVQGVSVAPAKSLTPAD